MTKYFLLILAVVIVSISCEDEEISTGLSNDNVVQLLTSDSLKNWTMTKNSSVEFDSCVHKEIFQFRKIPDDTSLIYVLKPKTLCKTTDTRENDTLITFQWLFADTARSSFKLRLISGDSLLNATILNIQPVFLHIQYDTDPITVHEFSGPGITP